MTNYQKYTRKQHMHEHDIVSKFTIKQHVAVRQQHGIKIPNTIAVQVKRHGIKVLNIHRIKLNLFP